LEETEIDFKDRPILYKIYEEQEGRAYHPLNQFCLRVDNFTKIK
jgi:hypothetical protein